MVQQIADDLLDFSERELGDDLRMVARYSRENYDPMYASGPLREQLNEETRGAFRYPFIAIHRAMWQLSTDNERLTDPEVVVHSYGTVQIVQFSIAEDAGVVLSCTGEHDTLTSFIVDCNEIVSEYRERQSER